MTTDTSPGGQVRRVVIDALRPAVDGGRFPAKRVVGDLVEVEADIFTDGHDRIAARLLYRHEDDDDDYAEVALRPEPNDLWRAAFPVEALGCYLFTVEAWLDPVLTWQEGLGKKLAAGHDIEPDLLIGADLLAQAARRTPKDGPDGVWLRGVAKRLRDVEAPAAERAALALDDEVLAAALRHPDRRAATRWKPALRIHTGPERGRFTAWYELFPRSWAQTPGAHGTLRDVEARLGYVQELGFDTLYLPPIHPIGRVKRKGRNNAVEAGPGDVGSPWAIGAEEGGHKAVHPALGTLGDLERLVTTARGMGIEIALDLALQCAPDHPYVRDHPQWFKKRPDGTIQCAENPPKVYEDIVPFDFECDDWQALWQELESIIWFWVERGVRTFRVDNPHTKPFPFWERAIANVQHEHRDVIFLAEAFTRPKLMYRLAKLGFTQSYTYFAWRNTRSQLERYLTELTQTPVREFFRPSFWPNTPDILTEYLQLGGRPAFMARLVLAATLAASYGIYGPAFELCENAPRHPGSEEYQGSEKYEVRRWDLGAPHSLRHLLARVNRIRRENPALQRDAGLRFLPTDNDSLIAYVKATESFDNVIVCVVNLDPHHRQTGWIDIDPAALGTDPGQPYQVHDLLGEGRFLWHGTRSYVDLDPARMPAQIFRVRRRVRTEQDFDYYL